MYQWTCKQPGVVVIVRDPAGQPIGEAVFVQSAFETADKAVSEALSRAALTMPDLGLRCVGKAEEPPVVQDVQDVPAVVLPKTPTDTVEPPSVIRRGRARKED